VGNAMLKTAIIGCGKIADSHAASIQRIDGCVIVAVCDREELMAQQLRERFAVPESYGDVSAMLRAARPDAVHITTPPQSHFPIAKQCLEAGCHVYVEKPFTVNTAEAEELISLAVRRGLKLTVGHDEQFSHATQRMRELVRTGYLGGPPVHMESTWCYDLGDQVYAKALLGDTQHWVRGLPGGLLQNVMSHGVAKIAEFLDDDVEVVALGRTSPLLSGLGERQIIDELRVIITDVHKTTAYFTFSSQMRPVLHQLCVYGRANGLALDEDRQTLIRLRGQRYKSYLEQFVPPLTLARQYVKNWAYNVGRFLARDFHADSGRKHLIEAFHRSITSGAPLPIPYREILLTSRIMDAILGQINEAAARAEQGDRVPVLS
jgi:predicted dehydrogenase